MCSEDQRFKAFESSSSTELSIKLTASLNGWALVSTPHALRYLHELLTHVKSLSRIVFETYEGAFTKQNNTEHFSLEFENWRDPTAECRKINWIYKQSSVLMSVDNCELRLST